VRAQLIRAERAVEPMVSAARADGVTKRLPPVALRLRADRSVMVMEIISGTSPAPEARPASLAAMMPALAFSVSKMSRSG
jgi:hypothetical protein